MTRAAPAGRIGKNEYLTELAADGRSKCKNCKCKAEIRQGELRIGKIPPRVNDAAKGKRIHWYHPACLFTSFDRVAKFTKCLESCDELMGFDALEEDDRALVEKWMLHKHKKQCKHNKL